MFSKSFESPNAYVSASRLARAINIIQVLSVPRTSFRLITTFCHIPAKVSMKKLCRYSFEEKNEIAHWSSAIFITYAEKIVLKIHHECFDNDGLNDVSINRRQLVLSSNPTINGYTLV